MQFFPTSYYFIPLLQHPVLKHPVSQNGKKFSDDDEHPDVPLQWQLNLYPASLKKRRFNCCHDNQQNSCPAADISARTQTCYTGKHHN
jgi:hypothetical protein